jgi:hypothetical protein
MTSLLVYYLCHTIGMKKKIIGSEPLTNNSSSSQNNCAFSVKEQQDLAAFFSILFEIDQQRNVVKGHADIKQD